MPHVREGLKRFTRKITGRQQKQPDIPPAAPSATGSTLIQQERSGGGSTSVSPIPPAAPSPSITPEDTSASGIQHVQPEQSTDSIRHTSPINTQQPTAAQSLWDQAYDALAKKMPSLVKDYDELLEKEQMANSVPNETLPSQLPAPHGPDTRPERSPRQIQLDTVIQIGLRRMEDNKTTYTIAGHEFDLTGQITQVSNFLLWGKDWIDSAVKASPEASLVWSGVCLILPLLTNPTTAAEANRDGFVYVTSRMRYYVALEPMLRRLGQNDKVDEALISEANDHIVDLYQAILDFQLSSVLRFFHSRLKTYAHDIVASKDWRQTLLDIKTREQTVNGDLGQINQLAARQELERLNNTSEKTNAAMENYLSVATQHLAVSGEQLTVLKQQQAAQEDAKQQAQQERLLAEQRKCLQLFYLTQNGNSAGYDWYKGRVERRVEGTCNWFLQHENFQKWLLQDSGPLLVSADPGCGKSVLAKYMIDHELAKLSSTICYFFFKDQDQNTIRQALCALLHQLFSQKDALIQYAMELYNKKGGNLVQSEESLWRILRDAVCDPLAGPIIFVIDALDECAASELRSLIKNLKDIFYDQQLANAKFRVLMTSRPYEQVVSKFYSWQDDFPRIHIPGEEEFESISQEINSVIHHRVEQLAISHRLSDTIKSSLYKTLLAIDHRTYLWVYLVFDYLEDEGFVKTDDGIDAAIQTLPESVNQAYDQILNRSQKVNTVRKALSIILAARRPLTISEMNIAMSLNSQGRGRSIYDFDLEQDEDFKSRLRTLCGLFVNVHHNKIYFLHQTAREFLIQSSAPTTISSDLQWHHSITTRHAHSVLAEICLFYLDRLNSTDTDTFSKDGRHGALVVYSVWHWGDHCREAEFEKGSAMVELASGLCAVDLTSDSLWASIIPEWYFIRYESSPNVLLALIFGLTPVTELFLSRGADIEARDDKGRTALMIGAAFGHEADTRLLLDKGAGIEARDKMGRTALAYATMSGCEAITRLLLEHGASVEAKNNNGETALMLVDSPFKSPEFWMFPPTNLPKSDFESVTRLLLENGADIEARDNDGRTALISAARSGCEAITRQLLEYGANVEARSSSGWTALLIAAANEKEANTRLLLEHGAVVEVKSITGSTALIEAAAFGREATIRLLLEHGADIEAKNNFSQTALVRAAEYGKVAVTRLLLDEGADVESRGNDGRTALMYAANFGHEVVTQLLLDNGANIEAKNKYGRTALMFAAKSGQEVVARLLLENGADIEAEDKDGWTVLMHAAPNTERLLLDNGAQDLRPSRGEGCGRIKGINADRQI